MLAKVLLISALKPGWQKTGFLKNKDNDIIKADNLSNN